jgi:hypothetical protein
MPKRIHVSCIAAALLVAACSEVVDWEEDVVLNTGETITVHGERVYERGGAPGNPLQSSWYVKPGGKLTFRWNEQSYVFQSHASPLLIAIAPDARPVVVAVASIGGWDEKHKFECTTPHYVLFVPDATGSNWSWPAEMPRWLHDMPANLLIEKPKPGTGRKHYSAGDVRDANAAGAIPAHLTKVIPTYTPSYCKNQ